MITQNKRLMGIILAIAFLLLIPFSAMQFTNEVKWSLFDFIVAGVLMLATALAIEFVLRRVKKMEYRIVLCLVILVGFVLIWLELAVGLFGTPIGGN